QYLWRREAGAGPALPAVRGGALPVEDLRDDGSERTQQLFHEALGDGEQLHAGRRDHEDADGTGHPSHPPQSRLPWGALPLAIAQTDGRQGDDFEALELEWLTEYNLGGVHPFQLFDALTQRWVEGRRVRHAPHSREEA